MKGTVLTTFYASSHPIVISIVILVSQMTKQRIRKVK